MSSVGFTTGSLYRSKIDFDQRIELYQSFGADAIELSFATPYELEKFNLSEGLAETIKKFASISIHAPWKDVRYDSSSITQQIIERLRSICQTLPIKGLVLHPHTIDNFKILDESGLPFLVENMDGRKSSYTHPKHFVEIMKKYNFGFVLDIEHIYEHDVSMQLGNDFIDFMGDRLVHMHVSGRSETEIHVPTHAAPNRDALEKILKLNINVPKILEGILLENIDDMIKTELDYVRNFEKVDS